MHTIFTVTLMHDRYLSGTSDTELEDFHWYQSSALFNNKLSEGPIHRSDRAAVWATAALLGCISFHHNQAKTAADAWPLSPPSPTDLNWLRMSEGKKEIWKIAESLKYDSVFWPLSPDCTFPDISFTGSERDVLPPGFIMLYNLGSTSTAENNPYHAPASALAQVLDLECNYATILKFMTFVGRMCPGFKQLMEHKDARALLLMAYWYAKVCRSQHWLLWRRTMLECQAICIYLERYYSGNTSIQELLQFPRTRCGLVSDT